MAKMRDALERQLAVSDAGETPDYDIVRGVVDCCLDDPDLHHHPKEDLVFERLKAVDPEAAAGVGDLSGEHAELAEIDARPDSQVDPLFGAPGEERFAALRQDILIWAEDAA